MNTVDPEDPEGSAVPDGPATGTRVEDLLTKALAARAEQVTGHSLRPAAPPRPNWAARGRGPLLFALAASVTAVALIGTAVVTMTQRPGDAPVADLPPEVVAVSPTASPDPTSSSGTASPESPSVPEAPEQPAVRTVTVVYGPPDRTFTLRTGGGTASLEARIDNTLGVAVEQATDVLIITPESGGTLPAGALSVSLRDPASGAWRPVGAVSGSAFEAYLTGASGARLGVGASRTHEVRVSLGEAFPAGISRLRVSLSSDGGSETLTYTP
ncbi:hypothetical protein [Streptomyces sp. NPDC127084]|uniref:hypothetical protein n=1 Tax=Streptomyces sp. NPDC127084 TaxID=3347133 RepID=UPI00365B4A72